MFGQIVEVRGRNHAFEMRNGQAVEFATDAPGQTLRLRSLGCPERFIRGIIAKRNALKNAPRQTVAEIDAQLRNLKAKLEAKTKTAASPAPVLTFNERLARVNDAVRIDRVNLSTEQQRQDQKDAALRKTMQVAAGIYKGD